MSTGSNNVRMQGRPVAKRFRAEPVSLFHSTFLNVRRPRTSDIRLALRKAASSREHSVILTSRQHRKIAKILRQNAPTFPFQKVLEHKMARVHLSRQLCRSSARSWHLSPGGQRSSAKRPRHIHRNDEIRIMLPRISLTDVGYGR